jgi:hypothetical protein
MVFLAGDNNLEHFGHRDLQEMKVAGSTDGVAVVAQFDTMSDGVTRRYYLTGGGDLETDVVAELPETNTGDPAALLDFITWAGETYPARRYGLVLWNHGSGWKDDDIYQAAQRRGVDTELTTGTVRGAADRKAGRALFSSTLDRLVEAAVEIERAILFDDTSADFLDSQELRQVLQSASTVLGQPLDLLGMDACLMQMVEVAYQVRDLCHVLVGSQEIEPGDGWPYDAIVSRLNATPEMAAEELGRAIVEAYIRYYRRRPPQPVTQSAVGTAGMPDLAAAVNAFGQALGGAIAADAMVASRVRGALRRTQAFTDHDYIDLAHFAQIYAEIDAEGAAGRSAQHIAELLTSRSSPIAAVGRSGREVGNATGLSIYLPGRSLSPLYRSLEFGRDTAWSDFLAAFTRPPGPLQQGR